MEQENYFDLWKLLMVAERDYLAARDAFEKPSVYSAGWHLRFDRVMAAKIRRDTIEWRLQKIAQNVCRQDIAASPGKAARQGHLFA
jgi:hypothetical protein